MKKLLLSILSFAGVSYQMTAQDCQTLLDDFESTRLMTSYTSDAAKGTLNQSAANPSATGNNLSPTCLKYTPAQGVYEIAKFVIKLNQIKNANLFYNGALKLSIDVYTPSPGEFYSLFRKNNAPFPSDISGVHSAYTKELRSADLNKWTTVVFEVYPYRPSDNSVFANEIGEIEIQIPSYGQNVYFDNIKILNPTYAINNYDSEANISILKAEGTYNPALTNASTNKKNSSPKCATFRKATGNPNAKMTFPINSSINPDKLKAGIQQFGMLLYAVNSISAKISLVDTNANKIHSSYTASIFGTGTGEWNWAKFALSSSDVNVSASAVDVFTIELDPGVGSTTLYRFDDIYISTSAPSRPSITGSQAPCSGINSYTYSVPKVNGLNYNWQIAGGDIVEGSGTEKVKVLFNSNPGTLSVRYEVPGGCNSDWATVGTSSGGQSGTATVQQVVLGSSPVVCANSFAALSGTYQGSGQPQWASSGSGRFEVSATGQLMLYYPSEQDGDDGFVVISYGNVDQNCSIGTPATLTLDLLPIAKIVDITPDATLCYTTQSVKVVAVSNVTSRVHWYGAMPNGFNKLNPVNSSDTVTYTFGANERIPGETASLKVETDYAYTCGYTYKFVKFTFGGAEDDVCDVTGITASNETEALIYPNPSSDGKFNVSSEASIKEIIVTNMLGQSETFKSKEFTTSLKGSLTVTITTETGTAQQKIFVE
jgi:hypothetical protein